MKKIVELEANSAQENGADGKSDSKQKKKKMLQILRK